MALTFDPQASSLSMTNAQFLGQAAAVAYETEATCLQWARSVGLDEQFDHFSSGPVVPHTDTGGFVAQNAQILLISFRGTQPNVPIDWMTDFQAKQVSWGPLAGKVHKGFYDALHAVWEIVYNGQQILPARLMNRGDRAVWITGHSLGGAIAELCAAQTWFGSHVPVQGVYTFGQPRCGDDAFATLVHGAMGQRIFRFINDRDIVPRVPLYGMGFRHYGCEIFFNHQGQQVNGAAAVENLAAALKLGFQAVNFDPIEEAAKMVAEAVVKSAFHGNPIQAVEDAMKERELAALGGDIDKLVKDGAENIEDHSMTNEYLVRLNTKLILTTAAAAGQPGTPPPVH
jgi:triacylglycerol lipase